MNEACVEIEKNGGQTAWVKFAREQVESIQFRPVQIVVYHGKVVQIERTEKIRFENSETVER